MKAIFLLYFGIFFTSGLICQALPQISTPDELEAYLVRHQRIDGHKYEGFRLGGEIFRTKDSVFATEILYGDFDQNGDDDLFAVGMATVKRRRGTATYPEMFFLIAEKNRYKKIEVPVSFALWLSQVSYCSPAIKKIENKDLVELQFARYDHQQRVCTENTDTLTVSKGRASLFTSQPENIAIEEVDFETTYCYGSCPVYRFKISNKGEVAYKGIAHVPKSGTIDYKLDRRDRKYLNELLQHLNPSQLKTQYSVNWTDSQTAKLTIKLADGRSLFVRDYGKKGTFGLTLLYDFFGSLVDELH